MSKAPKHRTSHTINYNIEQNICLSTVEAAKNVELGGEERVPPMIVVGFAR